MPGEGTAARRAPIVIAAGGTGGHLFPAEALAQELARRGRPIVLVTDTRGKAYAESFPASETIGVSAATFAGRGLGARVGALIQIVRGIGAARRHLRRLKPDAVVGFGGYPSLPAMTAAILEGVPSCIHEQNAVLGRVNRRIAPFATAVAATFPALRGLSRRAAKRLIVTGNPVRDAVIALAGAPYPLPGHLGPLHLLVFGGSQGAKFFADIVPPALAKLDAHLRARLHVVQQARGEDGEAVRAAYEKAGIAAEVAPFFKDLPARMAQAHLVIARGGASTVCELAAIGRPALIVPLPGAMDDHQTYNAAFLSEAGAALAMPQKSLTADSLSAQLAGLFNEPRRLAQAAAAAAGLGRPDATRALADLVESLPARRARGRRGGAGQAGRAKPAALLFSEFA